MQMHRYFVELAYKGTAYAGWQVQPNAPTVQGTIQEKLQLLLRREIQTVGCGRTDTGVHASQFFMHFDSEEHIDPDWLMYKMNHLLPKDIVFLSIQEGNEEWHARFGASQRTYYYFIHDRKDPFLDGQSTRTIYNLDLDQMNQAGEWLLTVEDFASFCKAGSDNKTTICRLDVCKWEKTGHQIKFTVGADRFLRNMVRSMVGTFIDLGRGKIDLEAFKNIVLQKERSAAGTSASAEGLFLAEVRYPFL